MYKKNEYHLLLWPLGVTTVFTAFDVVADLKKGSGLGHVLIEVVVFLAAVVGIGFILKKMKHSYEVQIQRSQNDVATLEVQNRKYKKEAQDMLSGLAKQIEAQFCEWELTKAEKEIGLFLIKGFSIKEIGDIRGVKEKTVRQQCLSLYKKSKLSGRAELAAFFLEDLLLPMKP